MKLIAKTQTLERTPAAAFTAAGGCLLAQMTAQVFGTRWPPWLCR
jgi:hypothetical protein